MVKDKTLIVVAHRLETIENSDKIVVVDQGKIVAEGTQSELLKIARFISDCGTRQY
ncbi:MAG: hypothetical protein ACLR13_08680 [Acutalibacteraceae bacterium]